MPQISFRPVSSAVERLIDIQEAVGSKPSPGTIFSPQS
jgi:hypothetical protein